ncbi:MAG: alginate lyase family protein [Gammaproteobacteria bacterium]
MSASDTFRFLNKARRCASAADWLPSDRDKLWVYNLHYFDDLNARDAVQREGWHRSLMERWVAQNPCGAGDGWEPYPISRRIVNWVKWSARGCELPRAAQESLAAQARWLMQRLEFHILGNHLIANAKALVYVGLYFDGVEAERWFARGVDILDAQIREQVLADGAHFELSTMYHATVLEDLLDLVNVLRVYQRPVSVAWLDAIGRMRGWLRIMSHPDGEIAFFNDAAFGIAPSPAELDHYAARLALVAPVSQEFESLVILDSSGYVRARSGPRYLVCDCAAVGPDYLPGHAHADSLSFELSVGVQRLFVNSGTSTYWNPIARERERGTAAHNTVVIDDRNSSDVWRQFRVAQRAHTRLHFAKATAEGIEIQASHDGYRHLPGKNTHTRRWHLCGPALRIEDTLGGAFTSARAHFHLHPLIEVERVSASSVLLRTPSGTRVTVSFNGAATLDVTAGIWHPGFGLSLANKGIEARFAGAKLVTTVTWNEATSNMAVR